MTKNLTLTEKQTATVAKLEAAGIHARWWGRDGQGERIYLNGHGRRDVKVWIEFDDAGEVHGAALKVRIDECGQHPKWYASQRAQFMSDYAEAFQIVTGQAEAEKSTAAVTEDQAANLVPGTRVEFYTGGEPSDSNNEAKITGIVRFAARKACDQIGETENVVVTLQDGEYAGQPFDRLELYTWRGVLRYGSGAQTVCTRPVA